MSDPRADWSFERLGFELLRRRPEYRQAWADFQAEPDDPTSHGWAMALARSVGSTRPVAEWAADTFGMPFDRWRSRAYSVNFGLEYLLDPHLDAEAHQPIPWIAGRGPVPVEFERGPELVTLEKTPGLPPEHLWTRFVTVRFDLGRPIAAQLKEAKELLLNAQKETQGDAPRPSRGRSAANIAAALTALDMAESGASAREIGSAANSKTPDPADYGKKLLRTARKLSAAYLTVATGLAPGGKISRRKSLPSPG